jgi:NDP-sugar pyrophosphorylase family protein
MTAPDHFFDLVSFEHKEIFSGTTHVWQALTHLKEYLKGLPLGKIEGTVSSGAFLVNPSLIYIGHGTVVEPGAYIQGPCYIGKDCQIRHGAYIRGEVLTGNKCVIGHTTEVKTAIFLEGAHAAHFAYVGDSILGAKVNLGAGVKCANFRLDHKNINVRYQGQKYMTGMRKLGAIIGDGSQIGCNSVTNPGSLLSKGALYAPCTNILIR